MTMGIYVSMPRSSSQQLSIELPHIGLEAKGKVIRR